MREIDGAELHAVVTHAFVRHQIDPATTKRAWLSGRAVVVDGARWRPVDSAPGPAYTCLGLSSDLAPLMAYVAVHAPCPWRLTTEHPSYDVPDAWHRREAFDWHWMLTDRRVSVDDGWPVVALDDRRDAVEIDDLLDDANPDSFARPGSPGVAAWMGIRERTAGSSRLVAAGALQQMHDNTLHLRGVTVRPELRGGGAGTTLSAALTNHALKHGSGIATLGVYTTNLAARTIYDRLGYRVRHTFTSGEVGP